MKRSWPDFLRFGHARLNTPAGRDANSPKSHRRHWRQFGEIPTQCAMLPAHSRRGDAAWHAQRNRRRFDHPAAWRGSWAQAVEGYRFGPTTTRDRSASGSGDAGNGPERHGDGPGPTLCFHLRTGIRPERNRIHLDLQAADGGETGPAHADWSSSIGRRQATRVRDPEATSSASSTTSSPAPAVFRAVEGSEGAGTWVQRAGDEFRSVSDKRYGGRSDRHVLDPGGQEVDDDGAKAARVHA